MRSRLIGIGALLVLGTLFWTVFGLGLWAQRQALDTDNWVDTSGDLLASQRIRNALGLFLVDRLYSSEDVQKQIEEVLPPRLDPLAAPAAAGLKEIARRNAPRLLGSALALNAWREANREAHGTLLDIVRHGDSGSVTLNLQDLLRQIADGSGLPAGAVDRLPPELAQLQLARPDQLDTAEKALNLLEDITWILLALGVGCFAGSISLAADRRRATLNVGVCLIVGGFLLLAVRNLVGKELVSALADAPNATPAADDAWKIGTSLLVDVAQGSLLMGLFISVGAWLAGPGRRAVDARRLSAPALREHPGAARAGLATALLLLVIWGPVPWTTKLVPVLLFAAAAFVWLEWMRSRTVDEAPGASGQTA